MRELTVIFSADSKITAAQVRNEKGEARNLALGDLPASLKVVNEAALLQVAELEAELKALKTELDAYKARGLQASKAVARIIDDPALTPEQKAAAIKAVTTDIQANERERQRAAARAELEAAKAKFDALID